MSFRLPFRFGMMQFTTVGDKSNSEGDFPKIVRIYDPASQIKFNHTWTGITETEEGYNAIYTRRDYPPHNQDNITTQGLSGKATFLRTSYRPQRANPLPAFPEGSTVQTIAREMIDKSVHFIVRIPDDWLQEMTCMSVELERITWEENMIMFEGRQGAFLRVRGVRGVRFHPNYVLFDVYNDRHGYSYSFYMSSSVDLNK